jgi:hypothetical protein
MPSIQKDTADKMDELFTLIDVSDDLNKNIKKTKNEISRSSRIVVKKSSKLDWALSTPKCGVVRHIIRFL